MPNEIKSPKASKVTKIKGGRLSRDSEKFIMENSNTMSAEEMSEKLGVSIKSVESILDIYGNIPTNNVAWKQYLRRSSAWKQMKNQFTDNELDYFEDQYVKLMDQFKEDVLNTETTQILQLIKIEILMDRNLQSKKRSREQVDNLEAIQKGIIEKYGGDFSQLALEDQHSVTEIGQQIAGFVSGEQNATKEYADLQKAHNEILKMLKGAREQRIQNVENSKISFTGFVKSLMNLDIQEKEARQNELFKHASKKELDRLSQPHRFIDNSYDLPILSAETIENLEKLNLEEEKLEAEKLLEQQKIEESEEENNGE